jgi:hypothetical protein
MATTKDRNCTHLAGEYFVAAELSKRGYSIGITMGNAKAIDVEELLDKVKQYRTRGVLPVSSLQPYEGSGKRSTGHWVGNDPAAAYFVIS